MVVGFRVEDRLEGVSNFRSWKSRMLMLLNEHDLKDHILKNILEPEGARKKTRFKKNESIAMRILMDSVKDHHVPLIASQDTAKKMYDTLKNIYENENPSRILTIKDQLRKVKFTKDDLVSSYFLKIS